MRQLPLSSQGSRGNDQAGWDRSLRPAELTSHLGTLGAGKASVMWPGATWEVGRLQSPQLPTGELQTLLTPTQPIRCGANKV